jgi:hypothetical protein
MIYIVIYTLIYKDLRDWIVDGGLIQPRTGWTKPNMPIMEVGPN